MSRWPSSGIRTRIGADKETWKLTRAKSIQTEPEGLRKRGQPIGDSEMANGRQLLS